MKRYWLIVALLLAGVGSYAYAGNTCQGIVSETVRSPNDPTASEKHLLKRASPIMEIAYVELLSMYQHGTATIEKNSTGDWVVTAYLSGGGVLIAILDDTF
jgi:threonine dehydrogenase-like Zn-dependent dehydrogenase